MVSVQLSQTATAVANLPTRLAHCGVGDDHSIHTHVGNGEVTSRVPFRVVEVDYATHEKMGPDLVRESYNAYAKYKPSAL